MFSCCRVILSRTKKYFRL
uniref:Uncharacterized protein n=1 Tax=Rhizophora mucronata TaxID=61149 RepID=A0A2P2QWF4_RHIMU